MERIALTPIGVIRSEHTAPEATPIQPVFAKGCRGRAEVDRRYIEGLRDIEGFSHLYLIYLFDRAAPAMMTVTPFLQDVEHGVFATRSPRRPNPIGISIVKLLSRVENVLYLDGVDILDGTPLLDIKPYVGRFDRLEETRDGWQKDVSDATATLRGRRRYKPKAGGGQ